MSGFRYRLAVVLECVAAEHAQGRRKLAAALAGCGAQESRLARARANAAHAIDALATLGTSRAADFALGDRVRALALGAVERQELRYERFRREADEARAALAPLARRKSAIELHRARALKAFLAVEARAEAVELDELNAMRHKASKRGGR